MNSFPIRTIPLTHKYYIKKGRYGGLTVELSCEHGLCDALFELKSLQDSLMNSSTKYFGKLLRKIVGVDTIPFFLLTKKGLLSHVGTDINHKNGKEEFFTTNYFRIESIDQEKCRATISLLRPINIHGDPAHSLSDVIRLKKTSACIEIELLNICAIQTLDTELLKRKIIIEPKW
ncbi:hypothetical protein BGM26_13305 [Bacillus sp. FJAT-29790]|uniref:CotY/CotZ family spore coat protein n=1 Tax=Bacillus sp. FJAT-29790 TaxID=1895002 RepID=UPI001C21902B|nr:CotY/CotZ family spore coat protein [Bacillus sp. FJAT-29790]MBU8879956.1 hypothetical protein [Bacillus sp. FJAT-29790]